MSLHFKWFKVYFYATPIYLLRMVAARQRAVAIQNTSYGTRKKVQTD